LAQHINNSIVTVLLKSSPALKKKKTSLNCTSIFSYFPLAQKYYTKNE